MNNALPAIRWLATTVLGVGVCLTPASAQNRGELLYSTHCGACHTAQMHWRASRAVTDWASLRAEVRKWQVVAALSWSEADVLDVARYLNDSVYHFELMNSLSSFMHPRKAVHSSAESARAVGSSSQTPEHTQPTFAVAKGRYGPVLGGQ